MRHIITLYKLLYSYRRVINTIFIQAEFREMKHQLIIARSLVSMHSPIFYPSNILPHTVLVTVCLNLWCFTGTEVDTTGY